MSIQIALVLSVVIQFAAAVIAISLIRRTIANVAWWLISIGFLLMAVRRLFELFQVFETESNIVNDVTNSWLGVVTSVIMLVSLSFIKRIFNIQDRIDALKRENESKVFSAIVRTEEKQKSLFAKDLHDGLGPILSAVKLSVSAVADNVTAESDKKILTNTERLVEEAIKTIKEVSNNLSPHVLLNFGIVKALNSFVHKISENCSTTIHFNSNFKEERFSFNIETVVYRVVCELINNTIKHAGANNIFIEMIRDSHTLNIKYMDDGKGFDYDSVQSESSGMGLTNIFSRIKSVNGSCQIISQPDQGFNANLVINVD